MKEHKKRKNIIRYPIVEGVANTIDLIPVDPLGSYTGIPLDGDDKPVQDADDL